MEILFIDDEIDTLESIKSVLKPSDFNCTFISNSQEALSLINKSHFDVIVTDLKMPDLNGIELIKKIRETNQDIKIIIMTGYFETSYLLILINYQIHSLFRKPLNIREVITVLTGIGNELKEEEKIRTEFLKLKDENEKLKIIISKYLPEVLKELEINDFFDDPRRTL
jgi:two-component system, response regulator YesN